MRAARILFAIGGVAMLLYGLGRLLTDIPTGSLIMVGIWLAAAILIHDGILSPLVILVGVTLRRFVPDRGRRFLQFFLITAAMITVIAVPLIVRRGTEPPDKALLLQDYGLHFALLLGLLAVGTLITYAVRVARDHQPVSNR